MRVCNLSRYAGLLCLYLTVLFLLPSPFARGQQVQTTTVSISFQGESLDACLQKLSKQTGIGFTYVASGLRKIKGPTTTFQNETLEHILQKLLTGSGYQYKITGSQVAIIPVEAPKEAAPAVSPTLYKGVVLDAKGKPLEGVTVFNTTTHRGSSSDASGVFSVYAVPGQSVELSFIGHKTQKVGIKAATADLRVVLQDDISELGNTVIVGYSAKSAAELTGSVQTITGDDVRSGVTSVDVASMLKGKVTGVYIADQGSGDPFKAGGQLLVRGTSSMATYGVANENASQAGAIPSANFGPLIVVDGMISPYALLRDAVNPRDIATIVFLKDAASTAIYGSRGSAGVIVITTRKGASGRATVEVEQKYGWNKAVRGSLKFLNAPQLNDKLNTYYTEAWNADSVAYLAGGTTSLPNLLQQQLPTAAQLGNTFDWTKYMFRTTTTSETNATVSGGSEKSRYYMGLGYYRENGTQVDNYLNRYSFRFNTDNTVSKLLSFTLNLNGIFDDGNEPPFPSLYTYLPWYTPYNPDGSLKSQINFASGSEANPLFDSQYNYDKLKRQNIISSLKVILHPTSWMTLSSENSATFVNSSEEVYDDARSYMGTFLGADGYLGETTNTSQSLMTSNLLTIQKHFGPHGLSFLAGQEFQKMHTTSLGVNVNTIPAGFTTVNVAQNLGNFEDIPALLLKEYGIVIPAGNPKQYVSGGKSDAIIFSAFGEGEYDYMQKLFLTGSLRTDASTAFGSDKRYGTFYSVGGAWLASSEQFIKDLKALSLLKFRANYGTNGSQIGNLFLTQTLYGFSPIQYNGQSYANIASIGNPNLSWEVSKTVDLGMDLGLWKRITLAADWYNKRSTKLLQNVPLTDAVGVPYQYQNVGSVNNRGLEFNLNTTNVRTKAFTWTTNFNISFNKNKIVHLNGDSLLMYNQYYYYYLHPGDDLNEIKGVQYAGVDPQTGKPEFWQRELNAEGQVVGRTKVGTVSQALGNSSQNEMYNIGTTTPKFNGGFANTFSYKNVSLSILVEYVEGTRTYNVERQQFQDGGIASGYNQIAYLKSQHPWQTPGDTKANEPSVYWAQNSDYSNYESSSGFDNNSFLRIRNIRVDYDIPLHQLSRYVRLARFYVSVDNVYTLTNKSFIGTDPEAPYVGGSQTGVGEQVGMPRRYLMGLLLSF